MWQTKLKQTKGNAMDDFLKKLIGADNVEAELEDDDGEWTPSDEAHERDWLDRMGSESYWHHRTIKHVNSNYAHLKNEEPYYTVHEFYYGTTKDGEGRFMYDGFSFEADSPMSKQECEWMAKAFDMPPVIEVDDASLAVDNENGTWYNKWEWLNQVVERGGNDGDQTDL